MSTSSTTPSARLSAHAKPPHVASSSDVDKLKSLVSEMKFAMMTTIDAEGKLRSRPMGVSGELEQDNGNSVLWFFTYEDSHKVKEMDSHGHECNLSFSHPSKQTYLSVSGTGEIIKERVEMEKRWNPVMKAWFPKGLDEPGCSLLKVTLTKAEYWDAPSSIVAHAVSFVKAQLTGTPADPSSHQKLVLEGAGGEPTKKVEHKETMRGEEGKMHD